MAALAQPEDLKTFLGADDAFDVTRAELIIAGISSEVTRFAGQSFDEIVSESVALDGSGTSVILLPRLPVRDVTAVSETGVGLDPGGWEWNASGVLRRTSGYWVQRFRNVLVTYSHGWSRVPDEVALLVLRVAARGYVNPTATTNESMGGYTAGYGFNSDRYPTLSASDREVLRPYMAS